MQKSKSKNQLKKEERSAPPPFINILVHPRLFIPSLNVPDKRTSSAINTSASALQTVPPLSKRQKQPSIHQFLPSHDLVGVWVPARTSKRARSDLATTCPFVDASRVTLKCRSSPPSPLSAPHEQLRVSQEVQDHFSLTLSLDSNTEDECIIDNEHGHDQQVSQELQPAHQLRQEHLEQQGPPQPPTQVELSPENIQPLQMLLKPKVESAEASRACSSLARVGLHMHVDSSLALSSSATLVSSSSSSFPSSGTALSRSTLCSSMADSSTIAGNSFPCSHPVSAPNPHHLLRSQPQVQALTPPVPIFTRGLVVLGAPFFFAVLTLPVPTLFLTRLFEPQRVSWFRERSATLQVCSRRSHHQTV